MEFENELDYVLHNIENNRSPIVDGHLGTNEHKSVNVLIDQTPGELDKSQVEEMFNYLSEQKLIKYTDDSSSFVMANRFSAIEEALKEQFN